MRQWGFVGELFAIHKSYDCNDNEHADYCNGQKAKHEFGVGHAAVDAYEHVLRVAGHGHEAACIGSEDFCHKVGQGIQSRACADGYDDGCEYQNDGIIDQEGGSYAGNEDSIDEKFEPACRKKENFGRNHVEKAVGLQYGNHYHHSQEQEYGIEIYEAHCLLQVHHSEAQHCHCTDESRRGAVYVQPRQFGEYYSDIGKCKYDGSNKPCTHVKRLLRGTQSLYGLLLAQECEHVLLVGFDAGLIERIDSKHVCT